MVTGPTMPSQLPGNGMVMAQIAHHIRISPRWDGNIARASVQDILPTGTVANKGGQLRIGNGLDPETLPAVSSQPGPTGQRASGMSGRHEYGHGVLTNNKPRRRYT